MITDISRVLSGEILSLDINYEISADDDNSSLLSENLSGALLASPVAVKGTVKNSGGYVLLSLTAGFDYAGQCARCLDEVKGHFSSEFERPVAAAGSISPEDEDDYVTVENGRLDIDTELCEELALSFPTRLLCSEDCKGLCPKCGKPLRDGDCGCETKEIDPRLKILAQLLEK